MILRPPTYLLTFLALGSFLLAEEDAEKPAKEAEEKESAELPEPVSKVATVQIDGKEIEYTVTASMIVLPSEEDVEKETARIFHIAYERNVEEARERPIAFCFNGGPGSSSVWLHLGALGPQRVALDEAGDGTTVPPPPYGVVPNEFSILDEMDLVFIDPVSTGFSRPEDEEKKGDFHGLEGDIRSVGRFIHQYCSEHDRWASPKYLIGESYGGLRAAAMAEHLQNRYGMYLNGVVLVSALVDYSTILFGDNNDLPYHLFLSAYAATAAWHGQIEMDDPVAAYEAALEFANGDYADALFQGANLAEEDRQVVAERLAELTGLEVPDILRADLRLDSSYFRKLLLREEARSVGRFDSRVIGMDGELAQNWPDHDASYASVYGPFASAFNSYLRGDLGYESPEVYEILTRKVHPWDFDPFSNRYVAVGDRLASAMIMNPHLKVLVMAGYYDLATPPAAIEYSMDHLNISPELRENIEVEYYDGGHMMYTNLPALEKLRADLLQFLR